VSAPADNASTVRPDARRPPLPTEQGADARTLGLDLAATCGAALLLVSTVAAV